MLKSATRLSLLVLMFILSFATILIVLYNVKQEQVVVWIMTLFGSTVWAVVGFYFRNSNQTASTSLDDNKTNGS